MRNFAHEFTLAHKNRFCPLKISTNEDLFRVFVVISILFASYTIILSIAFFIKAIRLQFTGTGLMQRWLCFCSVTGLLPVLANVLFHIVHIQELLTNHAIAFITTSRHIISTAQLIRNWTYVFEAALELFVLLPRATHDSLEIARVLFYPQALSLLIIGIAYFFAFPANTLYQALPCARQPHRLPASLVRPMQPFSVLAFSQVATLHVLPGLALVVIKTAMLQRVMRQPTSDQGLKSRWSLISTEMRLTCWLFGALTAQGVGEVMTWLLPYQSWLWPLFAGMGDSFVQVAFTGGLGSEVAMRNAGRMTRTAMVVDAGSRAGVQCSTGEVCDVIHLGLTRVACGCWPRPPNLAVYANDLK